MNFSGNDTVRFSANNKNGINEIAVPAFVQSINDPPFINVPKFIILKGKEDKSLIFDKARDKFEFCVGDPDLLNFPGMYMDVFFNIGIGWTLKFYIKLNLIVLL